MQSILADVAVNRSNPLALAVLVCLEERPMHPYEISQTLKSRSKDDSVRLNFGSLYGVVASLLKRGLVIDREVTREGRRPERTVYEITAAGRSEMIDWLTDLVASPAKEYLQFEAALTFLPALHPDEALAALQLRAQRLDLQLAHAHATRETMTAAGLPRIFGIEGEYVEALLVAEIQFTKALVAEIESGELPGMDIWRQWSDSGELPELPIGENVT
ncbi:MAG: PadR family transcriptional regulator [Ilumatobacteraceae bacterium]|nr:PadR family transcriptional regulator [Ilumatobacteraceae bacterium]MCU1391071.1 PadR family transcriptional regulator [Ilumatobacteraceae bacterium]